MYKPCPSSMSCRELVSKVFVLLVMMSGLASLAFRLLNFEPGVDAAASYLWAMSLNASLGFAMLGLSLLASIVRKEHFRAKRFWGFVFALVVMVIVGLAPIQGFQVDDALVVAGKGFLSYSLSEHGGGMAWTAAICLLCLALALILQHAIGARLLWFSESLAFLSFGLGMSSVLGLVYDVLAGFSSAGSEPMPLPVSCLVVLSSCVLLLHRPEKGLIAELAKPLDGGHMTRYLVPLVLLIATAVGVMKLLGEVFSVFDAPTAWSLVMMAQLFSFAALIWYQAKTLNLFDVKQRRQALALAEKAKLIDLTSDAILVRNLDGVILFWNQGAEALYGWSRHEAFGKRVGDLLSTKTADDSSHILAELEANGRWTGESWQRTKNGRVVTVMSRLILEKSNEFHADLLIETHTDLTESQLIQNAMQRHENRLAMALESSHMVLWEIDCVTHEITLSANYYELLGLGEALGRWDAEILKSFVHPEDLPLLSPKAFLGEKGEGELEFRVIWPDQSVHWVSSKGRLILHDGAPSSVAGILMDITERKRNEEALRRSEDFNRRIVENNSDSIKVVDREGRLLYISPRAQKELDGTGQACALGDCWFDFWKEKDVLPRAQQAFKDALRSGHGSFQGYRQAHDGQMRWWDVVLTAAMGENSHVENLVVVSRDITLRTQAENALRESESRLRLAIESTGLGLWDLSLGQGEVTLSMRARHIFGLPEGIKPSFEMFLSAICPEDRVRIEQAINMALDPTGSGYYQEEYRFVDVRTGQQKWLSGTGQAFFADGMATRFVGTILDITERKMTEARLRDSSERLRLLVDANPIGVMIGDFDGPIKEANQSFLDSIGATREDLLAGRIDGRLLSIPDDASLDRKAWREIRTSGRCAPYEKRYRLANGKIIHVLVGFSLIGRGREGVAFILDITGRKQMEQELARSKRLFQQIAETTPDLLYLFDLTKLESTFVNSNSAMVLGYEPTEIAAMGRHVLEYLIHPEDLASMAQMDDVLDNLKEGEVYEHEYRMRHKRGGYRWIRCREVVFSRDVEGRALSVLGQGRDVTERRMVEAELLRAKEAADAANQAKSTFLANMSHEIRTPIGVIIGFTEIAMASPASTPEQAKSLQTIRRNAIQLGGLIDEVLDLSKVEAGCLQIDARPFVLSDLMEDVSASLSLNAKEKGIGFSVESLGVVPDMVVTDPMRLRQCLINIIGNAIKFTQKGKVQVTLRGVGEAGASKPSYLEFVVKDTGVGLSSEQMGRLFRPFSQADRLTTQRYGGTGLGLVLSRNLARALGGDLVLRESRPNQGSTFVLKVKIDVPTGAAIPVETAQQATCSVMNDKRLNGIRVLLVEDAPDNQLLVSKFLRMSGVHVEIACDGLEGVKKAMQDNYDIVLMDIQMPGMDGYAATAKLRAQGFAKPVVALTAHAFQEERQKSVATGFTDYLTKPIHRDELVRTVMRLVYPAQKSMPRQSM